MPKNNKEDSRKRIARISIEYLIRMAKDNIEYSPTLIRHAINYKKRHRVPFTWHQKRSYCNKCLTAYDGSEKVRVTNIGITIVCPLCNNKRSLRHPR
ncbi:MAG: hypothetical protein ACMXYL_03240 [Candidatus Woesearchaeota archaeon]